MSAPRFGSSEATRSPGCEPEAQIVRGQPAGRGVELAPGPAALVRHQRELVGLRGEARGEHVAELDALGERWTGKRHGGSLVRARLFSRPAIIEQIAVFGMSNPPHRLMAPRINLG